MTNRLEEYQKKRDFQRTNEPTPETEIRKGPLIFVVQKHHARQLHYDFRLEVNGVLKSWAVPKGPSLDSVVKRSAIMVEDHPIDYANFEGIIPKGEYGAGEVIVWDNGTYSPSDGNSLLGDRQAAEDLMKKGLEKGKISFTLRGHKLKGSWTLVKMQKGEKDWLLMKHRDEYSNTSTDILEESGSVISGNTIEEVKTNRSPSTSKDILDPKELNGAKQTTMPSTIAPMLASLAEGPFSHPDWIFEPKLDGYRIIAHIKAGKVVMSSRRGNDVTDKYAALIPDLSRQPASELILDGEVVALDEKGKQCFQCLQNYLRSKSKKADNKAGYPLIYYVFDILYFNGYDLRNATLQSRKKLLDGILMTTEQIQKVDHYDNNGQLVYEAAVENGLEGVMAKRVDSRYESGKRSQNWLKVKAVLSDDFVIGGYSVAESGRSDTFSSLLLGYFDKKHELKFAGHVGTGFDQRKLNDLKKKLDAIHSEDCPFSEMPPLNAATTWVIPELVAQVKFSEWTRDGRLRAPVFMTLRDDKAPEDVQRMIQISTPSPSEKHNPDKHDDILQQLQNPKDVFSIELEGNVISLNHINKVFWPATNSSPALTKRDLLTYLVRTSSGFLHHLKDRPITMTRYPNDITGKHFYQKHWSHPIPDFVQKVKIREEKNPGREYLVCNNLSTLLWLGQLANIEYHTWFSRIVTQPDMPKTQTDTDSILDNPDFVVFDLDPYIYSGKELSGAEPELNAKGFDKVCEIALWLKEVLDEISLNAFIKTSGKTGLHIYVPITRNLNYKAVRSAAETIGKFLVQKHAKEITTEWAQEKRRGKVFFDYNQNVRGKTLACAYSPRPTAQATVSTPLRWEELGKVYPTDFTILTVPDRLQKAGDLWADILSSKKDVNKVLLTNI